jgi:hypothetical protein
MAISRMVYARKLIQRFPNNPSREIYLVRDAIAPRFFRLVASELQKAIRNGTKVQQRSALANLWFLVGHLPAYYRIPLRYCGFPALRIPPVAHFVADHPRLVTTFFRRLLFS